MDVTPKRLNAENFNYFHRTRGVHQFIKRISHIAAAAKQTEGNIRYKWNAPSMSYHMRSCKVTVRHVAFVVFEASHNFVPRIIIVLFYSAPCSCTVATPTPSQRRLDREFQVSLGRDVTQTGVRSPSVQCLQGEVLLQPQHLLHGRMCDVGMK